MINEEVSKYHDLQIITEKIKQRGFYDQILEVLMTMFREESRFTFTELERILKSQNDEASIFEQFWINSEVFRSNLVLILTSMVNSIWRSEELVKQMLEEGYLSSDDRAPEPTASSRLDKQKRELANLVHERDQKACSAVRDYPEEPRGKTTISVVKPEEYTGAEYDFLSTKNNPAYKSSDSHSRSNLKQKSQLSASKNISNQDGGQRRQSNAKAKTDYFVDNSRKGSNYQKETEDLPQRGRSRSFDRSTGGRPRSANRDRSRDYASTYSHYSSVYSRILNSGEANKVKKLIGERNSDLDVSFYYLERIS